MNSSGITTPRRSAPWERAEATWRSQEATAGGKPVSLLTCGHTVPAPAIGGPHGWCAEHGVQRTSSATGTL